VVKIVDGSIRNSIFAAGSVVHGASVSNSIIRHEVMLEPDVVLEDCIIMDFVHIKRGARLRRVIVDRFNTISGNNRLGFDLDEDRNSYTVSPSGIVVVPSGRSRSSRRSYNLGHL
jgi:glucose-1-phosphate adenylyltransferase